VLSRRGGKSIFNRLGREQAALHPLAVHFCSIQCKDEYMSRLFGTEPVEQVVVERTTPAEVVVEREVPAKVVTRARRVRRHKREA
jgi:hypothetical protein